MVDSEGCQGQSQQHRHCTAAACDGDGSWCSGWALQKRGMRSVWHMCRQQHTHPRSPIKGTLHQDVWGIGQSEGYQGRAR